jgi:putative endonuclease
MPYYVYVLESLLDETYYVGSCANVSERLVRHNEGRSLYTKGKRPWKLLYSEEFPDRASAVRRENQIKRRKSKSFIEDLVRTSRM